MCDGREHARIGLTPACAGTSWRRSTSRGSPGAHPRVRGDICSTTNVRVERAGSPPRARGHQPDVNCVRVIPGLTPACAGTSPGTDVADRAVGAHPRVRGDITPARVVAEQSAGSPPRARGHHADDRGRDRHHGLTPACAGTSHAPPAPTRLAWGSPPRARGRQRLIARVGAGQGLTPACAGTSELFHQPLLAGRAHPRVRGDVRGEVQTALAGAGSPPRARGRRVGFGCALGRRGLTPACAGTSVTHYCHIDTVRAHPRVRGDVVIGDLA